MNPVAGFTHTAIAAEAAKKRPGDYAMQAWEIKRQLEAYKKPHQ